MIFLRKVNYSKPKVATITLFLLFSLSIMPIQTPKAQAIWGEFPAEIYRDFSGKLIAMMQGMMMGGLKTAAITSINSELDSIIGGSASQDAKFITNWQDFLVDQPKESANIAMNDYLSQTVSQGKASVSGYISKNSVDLLAANYEGFGNDSFSYGLAMNNPSYGKFSYFAQATANTGTPSSAASNAAELKQMALAHTSERKDPVSTYHGENIADAGNNFANLQLYLSGINNQWGYDINAQAKYAELLDTKKRTAEVKSMSTASFTGKNNEVTTPGIVIKDALVNAKNIGNQLLATAQNPGELATALVQKMTAKLITNGVGQAGAVAQKTIQNTKDKATAEFNVQAGNSGVGSLFKN